MTGRRLLIVDDEKDFGDLVHMIAEKLGTLVPAKV